MTTENTTNEVDLTTGEERMFLDAFAAGVIEFDTAGHLRMSRTFRTILAKYAEHDYGPRPSVEDDEADLDARIMSALGYRGAER